jgi:hypothetical protein
MEVLTDDLGSYVVGWILNRGDAASAAPSEPGASAVPEAFGILGPIPTIPSGCSALSRPVPMSSPGRLPGLR